MYIRIYILKTNKKKKQSKNTKEAEDTKEEKRIFPEKKLKKKFATARVKIFLVTRISGNKSFFFFQAFCVLLYCFREPHFGRAEFK